MDPYATHLPLLTTAILYVEGRIDGRYGGPILEVGTGHYSSPVLAAMAGLHGRPLVQTDHDPNWREKNPTVFSESDPQAILNIHERWGVVFVDSGKADSRAEWIRLAKDKATLVVFHDADDRYDHLYGYSKVRPLFRYRFRYEKLHPATEVVSNYVDVGLAFRYLR